MMDPVPHGVVFEPLKEKDTGQSQIPLGPAGWSERSPKPVSDLNLRYQRMLEEIRAACPRAIERDENGTKVLSVKLPHHCEIRSALDPDTRTVKVLDFDTYFNRYGIGTRLFRAFAAEVRKRGYTYLTGAIIGEGALKTRANLFGFENLEFYYEDKPDEKLHFTYEEMQEKIAEYENDEWEGEYIMVGVNLEKYDFSDCEECIS